MNAKHEVGIKIVSSEQEKIFICQVCESTENLFDVTFEAELKEELGRMVVFKDETFANMLVNICQECGYKLQDMIAFRKKYEITCLKLYDLFDGNQIRIVENTVQEDLVASNFTEQPREQRILGKIVKNNSRDRKAQIIKNENNAPKSYKIGNVMKNENVASENVITHKHPTFTCVLCENSYETENDLRSHVVTHVYPEISHIREGLGQRKELPKKTYICNVCDYKTNFLISLKSHKLLHRRQLNYNCTKCSKIFINRHSRDNHLLLVHYKVKPYSCGICHISFSHMFDFKNHIIHLHG